MIKAVIFDLDGVIVDSEPIHSKSLEILLKDYGKTPIFNTQGLIHEVGPSGDFTYVELIRKYSLTEPLETIKQKRRAIFTKLLQEKLVPLPGFTKLLKIVKKENLKVAIASNRLPEHLFLMLENLGVKEMFDVVIGKNKLFAVKPAPDIYLKTADELSIEPKYCVAIEDSETGVLSAHAAGMKVIAVPNRYTSYQDFLKADKIVNSLSDITIPLLNSL